MTIKDYMSTDEEVKKHPNAIPLFQNLAGGDQAVFNFVWSTWNFEHAFDDLVDGANLSDEKKEQVFKALHDFIVDLLVNPFVLAHREELRGLLVSAMTRCLDGDRMEKERHPLAPAVRCGDVDLIMHIAYLHRGWEYVRSIGKYRQYDTPDTKL